MRASAEGVIAHSCQFWEHDLNIQFDSAEVSFGDRIAVKPLSLSLTERRIGVIGLNGSGKTTFVRMINGLARPSAGRVVTNGYDTSSQGEEVRRIVGFIFQNPANQIVLPHVKDDIALGLQPLGLSRTATERAVRESLERLGISHLVERRAHDLSGGELQLAALASVLVTSPEIVIMDEPTNQLDLRNRNRVQRTIQDLSENVIVVSHDLPLLEQFERILLFHQGSLVHDGVPDEVIRQYQRLAT